MEWVKFDLLGNLSTKTRPVGYPQSNPTQYLVGTRSLPIFKDLYRMWYTIKDGKKVKVLPDISFLEKYFNEASLAHWIMNDGYWDGTIIICTERFTKREVAILQELLLNKFGIMTGTKKRNKETAFMGGVRLRFSGTKRNMDLVFSLVSPHMHKNMMYKFGPYRNKNKQDSENTHIDIVGPS